MDNIFGIRKKCCLCCLCCRVFLTTTRDNLGQHFWNKIEMLSLLSCFFDDNERQPWTTLFGNRNVVFVVCVVVTFFDDNEGQPIVVCGKQNTKRVMVKQKKIGYSPISVFRAHEKTRTSKSVRSLHPECSVFTNFTTWALRGILGFLSAQDKSRTCTTHSSLPPQSSVSTNFTTWAFIFEC